jgi:hypothetical protein
MLTMIRTRTAAVLLGASIVGGVAAGVAVDALTSSAPRPEAKPRASTAPSTPEVKTGVEVKDPVLVSNKDGGATLSATLINHTDDALDINRVTGGRENDIEAPALLVYADRSTTWLEPAKQMTVGEAGTGYLIQFRSRVQVGSVLPITLTFTNHGGRAIDPVSATFQTPVVERRAAHADVADSDRNAAIRVNDPMIVVIPGQEKAYVGGYITSTIQDTSFELPTAVKESGEPVQYRHQTATGGPFGVFAVPGEKSYFRPLAPTAPVSSRFLDDGLSGSADYFRASDLTVGEKITVTMRFPSGDVVTKFPVVQGRADGTI